MRILYAAMGTVVSLMAFSLVAQQNANPLAVPAPDAVAIRTAQLDQERLQNKATALYKQINDLSEQFKVDTATIQSTEKLAYTDAGKDPKAYTIDLERLVFVPAAPVVTPKSN
jgi:hypothetical protein